MVKLILKVFNLFIIIVGFVPATDLYHNWGRTQKFFMKYVLHGMLRFAKITRSIGQATNAICTLVTDEKYKGSLDNGSARIKHPSYVSHIKIVDEKWIKYTLLLACQRY